MNEVSDNNDLPNIREVSSLVNTTSNGKEFCFSGYNICDVMNSLNN